MKLIFPKCKYYAQIEFYNIRVILNISFELLRMREDKNEIRELVYGHTCMKI
jgi:hypothetical protein